MKYEFAWQLGLLPYCGACAWFFMFVFKNRKPLKLWWFGFLSLCFSELVDFSVICIAWSRGGGARLGGIVRKNLDIIFGLAAGAVGIFHLCRGILFFGRDAVYWASCPAPALWTLCVVLMFFLRNRRPLSLVVWPSLPLAFVMWVLFAIMMFGKS